MTNSVFQNMYTFSDIKSLIVECLTTFHFFLFHNNNSSVLVPLATSTEQADFFALKSWPVLSNISVTSTAHFEYAFLLHFLLIRGAHCMVYLHQYET